jgi:hypothetical protein
MSAEDRKSDIGGVARSATGAAPEPKRRVAQKGSCHEWLSISDPVRRWTRRRAHVRRRQDRDRARERHDLRASTTYIDESIFSYNLARGDDNVWRSSQDGLIYYAQNAKEVLKTGLWVVIVDLLLSALVWIVMLAPASALGYLMPGKATVAALIFAVVFAANVRSAILRPLFSTMVMVKCHHVIHEQPIDLVWDDRLSRASSKFAKLKREAQAW